MAGSFSAQFLISSSVADAGTDHAASHLAVDLDHHRQGGDRQGLGLGLGPGDVSDERGVPQGLPEFLGDVGHHGADQEQDGLHRLPEDRQGGRLPGLGSRRPDKRR